MSRCGVGVEAGQDLHIGQDHHPVDRAVADRHQQMRHAPRMIEVEQVAPIIAGSRPPEVTHSTRRPGRAASVSISATRDSKSSSFRHPGSRRGGQASMNISFIMGRTKVSGVARVCRSRAWGLGEVEGSRARSPRASTSGSAPMSPMLGQVSRWRRERPRSIPGRKAPSCSAQPVPQPARLLVAQPRKTVVPPVHPAAAEFACPWRTQNHFSPSSFPFFSVGAVMGDGRAMCKCGAPCPGGGVGGGCGSLRRELYWPR